ncbi:cache domain-containing protein [Brevundimonas sp.]|uniref:sensor histidine kinase n=1 Tax=Brevundimonas sp. TaxID=1871086 RepID=UPI0025C13333|nr:cache domain-containing protein [Brevundimonas sp.]
MPRFLDSAQGQWRVFAVFWLVIAVVAAMVAGEVARREARAEALRQAATATALHAAVLRSELERHRSLPMVLAQDPDLQALLARPDAGSVDRLNRKFEGLARETRAAVIYVLDARGLALAASNWNQPISFVGSDYRFRPYFYEAMRDGQASFFALGTVSGRPGLYLSRRIAGADGRPLGVIVAKVEFDALETEWRASGEPTYVTDGDGVVLITTVSDWRFHTTGALRPDRRRRLAVDQTAGRADLSALPFEALAPGLIRLSRNVPPDLYARASAPIPDLGWRLHLLSPAGAAISRSIMVARVVALLSVALLAGLTGILLRRRQRAIAKAAEDVAARIDLERQVDARTAELRAANDQLNLEIEERRRLEKGRQDLQDELIQANKLGALGQIAAGVAHEINQPIAAIRTHADTASVYLERQDTDGANRALTRIGELTQRVGAITDELRAFSRKTRSGAVPVSVEAAIDGALLLVGARLRERGVTLQRGRVPAGLEVRAERNRLEQVVLNLLQNAIEALEGVPSPVIDISVTVRAGKVTVRISDNGPGVSPEVLDRLFTPFTTDKRDGMGLGLVISRDIVAGFGGELVHEPSPEGAVFKIVLAKAA